MIQTITVDIINEKALRLLQDMELMQLIRLRKKNLHPKNADNLAVKYKGTMQKQSIEEIDNQTNSLRSSWE
jgi:hypothetical protein